MNRPGTRREDDADRSAVARPGATEGIEVESSAGERAVAAARASLAAEQRELASRRTRQFLVAQSTLLIIAMCAVAGSTATGLMAETLSIQSILFTGTIGALTLGGWFLWRSLRLYRPLVLALLYADSFLGLLFFYFAGMFETSALNIITLCVVMAPMFARKGHAWGLATAQVVGYASLLLARQYDLLPYGYMLPEAAVLDPSFVIDCLANFSIATFGAAYLAGLASNDSQKTQEHLAAEVEAKTRALATKGAELEATYRRMQAANAQLEEVNEKLKESHDRLDQFNATVSHDLKSPLQTLIGRAEMIAMAGLQNPQRAVHLAEDIADAAERMGHQIDELLKLSRLGERLGDLEPVSLGEAVSTASSDLEHRLRTTGANLEIVHPLPTAWGNSALLKELFQNLIENAVKYGNPTGACIRISPAVAPLGSVAVAVEDDGMGIPDMERQRVFGLFKRMDGHHHREGVGAGLAIVRRIIEVHGGTITIEDGTVLPGARFVVVLPAPTGPVESLESPAAVH